MKLSSQPVNGLVTVPEQSRFALISTWVVTHPPCEWSLNPLCINEIQNSLPCVDVFWAKVAGKVLHKNNDNMTNIGSRFIFIAVSVAYRLTMTFFAIVPSFPVATKK